MDLARIEQLKQKLATAKDLDSVFHYFMDHLGENEEFLDAGSRTRNPALEAFITAIGRQLLGGKCNVSNLLLIAIPKTPFIHGACLLNGRPANVLYFDDIKTGLVAVLPTSPRGMTQYSRFSGRPVPPEAAPSEN